MNAAHLHLLVNHVPIIGSAFGLFFLLLSLHPRFGANVRRAGLILFVVTGLFSFISVESGEKVWKFLLGIPGVQWDNMRDHIVLAKNANIVAIITALVALFILVMDWIDRKFPSFVRWLAYLLGIVTFVMMVVVGERGGMIHHPEVIKDWKANHSDQVVPDPTFGKKRETENSESSE